MHDTLRYVKFYIKKSQTLQNKSRLFALCLFLYKNPDTLRYTNFHGIFEIGGREGWHFYSKKNNAFCVKFYMRRTVHFP